MTTASESTQPLPDALAPAASRGAGAAAGDTPAVARWRAAAAAAAAALPLPTRLDRPWKYLDLSQFDLASYEPLPAQTRAGAAAVTAPTASPAGDDDALIEFEDGRLLRLEAWDGLLLGGMDSPGVAGAVERFVEAAAARVPANRLDALRDAFADNTAFVVAAADAEFRKPVRVRRRYTVADGFASPRTVIVTGANARLTVVEEFTSSDDPMLVMPAVDILPGPGSVIHYAAIHAWGGATTVFAAQQATPAPAAELIGVSIVLGGATVKCDITSHLTGRGSASHLYGLFLGDGNQHCDFYTLQDHVGRDTRSDLLFKSALRGSARSVYYGLTRVGLDARGADAVQENRNLLLSKTARADSDPVLEILTNDVIRAAHGATAGPVDETQLFYLQSRGISPAEAEALLVRGYLGEVLDRLPEGPVRDEVTARVEAALEGRR